MPMQGYRLPNYYRITVKELEVPWPCEPDPDRTITLYDDDAFTKSEDGTYMKHTGLGCFNIRIPDDKIEFVDKAANLEGI